MVDVKNLKIGQRLRVVQCSADMKANIGDIVTVSDIDGGWVYVEGNKRESMMGINPRRFELEAEPVLDLTKPVRTVGGRTVTILTTSAKGNYPVVGQMDDTDTVVLWKANGEHQSGHLGHRLENVPKEPLKATAYINMWDDSDIDSIVGGYTYATREEADNAAKPYERSTGRKRIGVVKVELVEGTFDS